MKNRDFITGFGEHFPEISDECFVDVSARIIGRVKLERMVTVWPGAVLRGDDESITMKEGSAALDLSLIEAPTGHPVVIEKGALISHQACIHGATIKTGALVGIGAVVLDGAVVEEGALVGAGAVVPPGAVVPAGMLMLGQPAKPFRELKPVERKNVEHQLADLWAKAQVYLGD